MRAASGPLDTAEIVRLLTALRAAVDIADHSKWADARTHAATIRLRAATELIAIFLTTWPEPSSVSETVDNDLRQLLALPVVSDPLTVSLESLESAALIGDRITYTLAHAGELRHSGGEDASAPRAEARNRLARETLGSLSQDYGEEVVSERRMMLALYVLFAALTAVGVLIAWIGLERAQDEPGFSFAEFSAYGLVAVAVAIFGTAAMWQASRHRRDAREAARLGRQLIGFEAYIAPMPARLRNLLRGTMMQQLFPLLPEDDEPWRQPQWPNANSLLDVLENAPEDREGS